MVLTLLFLAVPFALLQGGVLAVLAGAIQDRWAIRWRWMHGAAAAALAAGLVWTVVVVTRVDEYRLPSRITLWDLMEDGVRWWVVIAMAAGVGALVAQLAALALPEATRSGLRTWAMPVAAAGMFLLFSVFFVVIAVGSH